MVAPQPFAPLNLFLDTSHHPCAMPPAAKKQSALARGIAAFEYIKAEDKSPLRPSEPILRTRWLRHLGEWVVKQDDQFPELID